MISWDNLINFLIFVGVQSVLVYCYDNFKSLFFILKSILIEKLYPEKKLNLKEKYGEWAVITGGSDGIGKEYAKQLARKGINVVLISNVEEALKSTALEIENTYSVKTKWIYADMTEGDATYKRIQNELSDIPVGILVNNVGQMYEFPQEFSNVPEKRLWSMVLLNVGATVMMTRMLINDMKKRKKGAIVNIGSITQLMPGPYFNVYSASKVFVKYFTIALQHEMSPYNITVQLINPAFVATTMNHFSSSLASGNFLVADVKAYAKSAVFTLGRTDETTANISHALQYAFSNLGPQRVRTFFGKHLALIWNNEYKKQIKSRS